jgi:hypothetical protein
MGAGLTAVTSDNRANRRRLNGASGPGAQCVRGAGAGSAAVSEGRSAMTRRWALDATGIARALTLLATALVIASCGRIDAEASRLRANADIAACRKVSLLELGDDPFGSGAPDCTIVVWDATMPGVQTDVPNVILPPKELIDAAATGGFHDVCSYDTNGFQQFLKHLPPGRSTESWHAEMWTRATKSPRTRAACEILEE